MWNNTAGISGNQIHFKDATSSITFHYSCYDESAGDVSGAGTLDYTDNCITSDPQLTTELRLQDSSPCIETGCNSHIDSIVPSVTQDLAGNPRIMDSDTGTPGGTVDIGAYEFQGIKQP